MLLEVTIGELADSLKVCQVTLRLAAGYRSATGLLPSVRGREEGHLDREVGLAGGLERMFSRSSRALSRSALRSKVPLASRASRRCSKASVRRSHTTG